MRRDDRKAALREGVCRGDKQPALRERVRRGRKRDSLECTLATHWRDLWGIGP